MKVSGNSDSVVGFLREFSAYVHSHLVGVYNLDLMVSCILSGHPLLLLGDTGTGKSRFSRLVASGLFGKSIIKTIQCAYFDITDIAGVLPHNENNRIKYDTKDKNSIWQADVLHLEELTRAPPEQQSNYLALLDESKSLFNQKLKYKAVIATFQMTHILELMSWTLLLMIELV